MRFYAKKKFLGKKRPKSWKNPPFLPFLSILGDFILGPDFFEVGPPSRRAGYGPDWGTVLFVKFN